LVTILKANKTDDITSLASKKVDTTSVRDRSKSLLSSTSKQSKNTTNTSSNNFDINIFNLNSFHTILNQADMSYCSACRPDQFVRDLLIELLKYCRNFALKQKQRKQNEVIRSIDLPTACSIYNSAEFKSILSKTKTLQHLNLNFMTKQDQKLSFFINLHNLLCIHSHFYLASVRNITNKTAKNDNSMSSLFHNSTERLLFQQRMCYKVGQMGCVSLYDLRHHILVRRPLNYNKNFKNYQQTNTTTATATTTIKIKKEQTSPSFAKSFLSEYSFFELNTKNDPLWSSKYLPSSESCDYRVLFALIDCTESDPPISVYDADDSMLNEQLKVQTTIFLNGSIHVDLCDDIIFLPRFLVDNASFFNPSPDENKEHFIKICGDLNCSHYRMNEAYRQVVDMEHLFQFIIENSDNELAQSLKSLLEEMHEIYGENLNDYGVKELSFIIERIDESNSFSLIIDFNNDQNNENGSSSMKLDQNFYSMPIGLCRPDLDPTTWYCKKIVNKLKATKDQRSKSIQINQDKIETTEEFEKVVMKDYNDRSNLNKSCLDYIKESNSSLISDGLSFLFDETKRKSFFNLLKLDSPISQSSSLLVHQPLPPHPHPPPSPPPPSTTMIGENNYLTRFIQLYVPLEFMHHLNDNDRLTIITKFLVINKTDETKIELIIDLANYYAQQQNWDCVLKLLNNCLGLYFYNDVDLTIQFNYYF
jgi:hypothetical protein